MSRETENSMTQGLLYEESTRERPEQSYDAWRQNEIDERFAKLVADDLGDVLVDIATTNATRQKHDG